MPRCAERTKLLRGRRLHVASATNGVRCLPDQREAPSRLFAEHDGGLNHKNLGGQYCGILRQNVKYKKKALYQYV